jgi:hypothetical protein
MILTTRRLTGGATAFPGTAFFLFLGWTLRGREVGPAAARGSLEEETERALGFEVVVLEVEAEVEVEADRAAAEAEDLEGRGAIFRLEEGGVRG